MEEWSAEDELRLRSREYRVPCCPAGVDGVVGWNGEWGTYFFSLERTSIPPELGRSPVAVGDIYYEGGDPLDRITNIAELLNRTWNEIDWEETDLSVVQRLRDAPMIEAVSYAASIDQDMPQELEDYLYEAFDGPQARSEPRTSKAVTPSDNVAGVVPPRPPSNGPGPSRLLGRFGRRSA